MEDFVHFESQLDRFPKKGGEFFMLVRDEIAIQFVTGRKPERIRCTINGTVNFQRTIRPKEGGEISMGIRFIAKSRL